MHGPEPTWMDSPQPAWPGGPPIAAVLFAIQAQAAADAVRKQALQRQAAAEASAAAARADTAKHLLLLRR